MSRAFILTLSAIIAMMLALAFAPAFAQTPQEWGIANEVCQGEPILRSNGRDNPACKARDKLASGLIRKGWLPANHGVWLSPEQQAWFAEVLNQFDGQARANPAYSFDMMPAMLMELRRKLNDAQIFAIWNEQRPVVQAYAPFGAAIMTSLMQRLAMTYVRKNDPRYTLEQ